jgi:hypothetical protein
MRRTCIRLTLLAVSMGTTSPMAFAQRDGNPNPCVIPPNSGQYADLSVQWWQWAYSQPVSANALFDTTGADAGNGQPTKRNIYFLAGLLVITEVGADGQLIAQADRTITIPTGTRLFFPLLNTEQDNLGSPITYTVDQLRQFAKDAEDNPTELHASIDGVPVQDLTAYRVQSPVFSYSMPSFAPPDQNVAQFFGIDFAGTVSPAVGDGYYLLLTPLPRGEHVINFGGTNRSGSFALDITYHITVVPGDR